MSRTDSRTTQRELHAALTRHDADRMAEADRKNWGTLRWFKVQGKQQNRQARYAGKVEINRQLEGR